VSDYKDWESCKLYNFPSYKIHITSSKTIKKIVPKKPELETIFNNFLPLIKKTAGQLTLRFTKVK
jgi:hypothetical protein